MATIPVVITGGLLIIAGILLVVYGLTHKPAGEGTPSEDALRTDTVLCGNGEDREDLALLLSHDETLLTQPDDAGGDLPEDFPETKKPGRVAAYFTELKARFRTAKRACVLRMQRDRGIEQDPDGPEAEGGALEGLFPSEPVEGDMKSRLAAERRAGAERSRVPRAVPGEDALVLRCAPECHDRGALEPQADGLTALDWWVRGHLKVRESKRRGTV